MGLAPLDPFQGEQIKTDVPKVSVGWAQTAHIQIAAASADALNAASVHVLKGLAVAIQDVATGITNPDVPRNLSITANTAGVTGDVVVTGTNYSDVTITETFALNGTATVNGNKAFKTITNIHLPARVHTEVLQQETATVVGAVTTGVPQKETATVATGADGGITGSGNATVIVTAAGMTNSPKSIAVGVTNLDTTAQAAGKIRSVLTADPDVAAMFTVGGTGIYVSLTALVAATNDATLNIDVDNDTCTGLTDAPTSANTTAGVASGTGNATVIVTAAGMTNSPKSIDVAVLDSDTDATVAGKIRTALGLDADVSAFFTITGATTHIILTSKAYAANDASLNIDVDNGTCTGLTDEPSSANTTAGVALDQVSVGIGNKLGLPYLLSHNTVISAFLNDVLESTPPTVTTSKTDIESNIVLLDSALNGDVVDIYLIVA